MQTSKEDAHFFCTLSAEDDNDNWKVKANIPYWSNHSVIEHTSLSQHTAPSGMREDPVFTFSEACCPVEGTGQ